MTFFERIGHAIGQAVVGRRLATILTSLVVFGLFAAGIARARFSTDYRVFFSKEDPGLAAFEKLEAAFTKTDNVLFVVHAKDGTVFTPRVLEATQALTAAAWKIPHGTRVDSLTNFPYARAENGDIVQTDLVASPAASLDAAALARVRDVAMAEPLLAGSLVSRDGRTTAVNVTLRLPGQDPEEVTASVTAARALVRSVGEAYPEIELRASGMALMNHAFMETAVKDLGVMLPVMVAVILLAMCLLLRSALATLAVAVVLAISAVMSMALAGWLHYPLTPPAIAAPMIVLTVAVADGVHVVLATMSAMRAGMKKDDAIVHSLSENLEAITYTWLTTIVGFVCLNYSEAPPVRHLANMTCLGVTAAFLFSFTLLPALLGTLPIRARAATAATSSDVFRRMTDLVIRRRGTVLLVCTGLTAAAGLFASRLETNDQFVEYFDQSVPFRRDVDFTMKHLSGIYRLEFQVPSGEPTGINEPAYLARLSDFAAWLRAQPEVDHVYSLTDIVKRVNQVVHEDDAAHYRTPDTREAAAEALLLYEMSLPSGLDLTDRINVDKSATRVTVTVKDMSTKRLTAFAQRAEGWLRSNAPRAMWTEATGPVVIFSQLSDRNAKSMVQGDFVSLALISLCMVIVLRSLRLGVLSVVPNVVPIVIGYGLWRLTVGQMNIVASVAGSISLGIIVDDTIHFLTKYQAMRRKHGASEEAAMRATLAHVGPAMLSTSVILVLGFGVLTLSSFQMTSYLGWLSVIIVGVAPLADMVLAPALVLVFGAGTVKTERAKEPESDPRAHLAQLQTTMNGGVS
jgi:uncharacterized protein